MKAPSLKTTSACLILGLATGLGSVAAALPWRPTAAAPRRWPNPLGEGRFCGPCNLLNNNEMPRRPGMQAQKAVSGSIAPGSRPVLRQK